MAFDQTTRNRLARFVTDARSLLTEEFTRQLQHEYGLDPSNGEITPIERLTALDDTRRETAIVLRETLEYYLEGKDTLDNKNNRENLDRIVREQAFTVLNRLCALRMSEARDLILESISNGYQSKGFQLYSRIAGSALGETGEAYQSFLFSLMDEFAVDLPTLFDRFSPQGRLFPREAALLKLLTLIDNPEIDVLWQEDETIGWIYQYFNSKEERKAMRDASQAPRNSRELAVRNQFFTPRYVVKFLTDNTLGRIWYEMTKGETSLKDSCQFLVRRPNEVFLEEGKEPPSQDNIEEYSQEELLNRTVYIPHRPLKDPREIKMLDPACGSMHFGLYAFDLFEQIYSEAWEFEEKYGENAFHRLADLESLHKTYKDKEYYLRDIPRLIIERNIHGVDIDPRAVQIAGLSLWLRAQKSWQLLEVKANQRPEIRESNIVCAEPMPGDSQMLEDFLNTLRDDKLSSLMRRVWNVPNNEKMRSTKQMADSLAKLIRTVWQEMELAGEAGTLLKIEETLRDAIEIARVESEEKSPLFRVLEYGVTESQKKQDVDVISVDNLGFFDRAEGLVLSALREYSEGVQSGGSYRKRLFSGDASQGFSFIDLCRKRYDVALMNPPFGEMTIKTKKYFEEKYSNSKADIYTCFVDWSIDHICAEGKIGVISNRTFITLGVHTLFRQKILMGNGWLELLADLGSGILDSALVEVAAYIVSKQSTKSISQETSFIAVHASNDKENELVNIINSNSQKQILHQLNDFSSLPNCSFAYWLSKLITNHFTTGGKLEGSAINARVGLQTSDDFRFARLKWEVPLLEIGKDKGWVYFAKGGEYSPYYDDIHLVVNWKEKGKEIYNFFDTNGKLLSVPRNPSFYFNFGLTYPWRTSLGFAPRVLPADCIFAAQGSALFAIDSSTKPEIDSLCVLGVLNSSLFQEFITIGVGAVEGAARSYQVGLVQSLPWKIINSDIQKQLFDLSRLCVEQRRELDRYDETTIFYRGVVKPQINLHNCFELIQNEQRDIMKVFLDTYQVIDNIVFSTYLIESSEITSAYDAVNNSISHRSIDINDYVQSCLSQFLGLLFGRWDIRLCSEGSINSKLPNVFSALPICSPAMLQNDNGFPYSSVDLTSEYPLRINWDGILVDDEGNLDDVESRLHQVINELYAENSENIEQEVCQILNVKSIREYFRNPALFFSDHLQRYTKSRRVAPIYWPLSTPSCSYTLWLYYHRVNDQTLFKCINEMVDPKLSLIAEEASLLKLKNNRSNDDEKELERLSNFEHELTDFREELLRVAKFWKPNLNDGVEITAAPLWKLFQHKPWQKRLKETWQKLEAGEYDWAHLAYSIWPERVREKCKTDKSLAIAHDLEELFINPKVPLKVKKAKKQEAEDAEGWFNDD